MADGAVVNSFDPYAVRAQFPILSRTVNGRPLVYLDNAASAQKPRAVIDALVATMKGGYANVHRGLHTLSNEATEAYEAAREVVARFLNAPTPENIVWTKGGTEAINLVANGLGLSIQPGDEIIVSEMEHHSNIVPWHLLRERRGAVLKWIPVLDDGSLDMAAYADLLGPKTRMVAVTHMSNVLGTVNPIAEITRQAHAAGARGIGVEAGQSLAVSHSRTTSLASSCAIRSTTSIRKAWVSRARASSAGMPRCCM